MSGIRQTLILILASVLSTGASLAQAPPAEKPAPETAEQTHASFLAAVEICVAARMRGVAIEDLPPDLIAGRVVPDKTPVVRPVPQPGDPNIWGWIPPGGPSPVKLSGWKRCEVSLDLSKAAPGVDSATEAKAAADHVLARFPELRERPFHVINAITYGRVIAPATDGPHIITIWASPQRAAAGVEISYPFTLPQKYRLFEINCVLPLRSYTPARPRQSTSIRTVKSPAPETGMVFQEDARMNKAMKADILIGYSETNPRTCAMFDEKLDPAAAFPAEAYGVKFSVRKPAKGKGGLLIATLD